MAAKATVILDDDDDDEITVLSTTPAVFRRAAKTTIDLTADDDSYDVVATPSSSKRRRRFYRGESSNSKTENDIVLSRSFTCEICTDEKPVSDSFNITGCIHLYCTQCIINYVAARLQNNVININCPFPACRGILDPPHCRTILPKSVFERWGDALCEALILGKERYYCPYKNCSALLIVDANEKLTQSECPECRRLFCVACKAAWHSGMSCEEFKLKDESSNGDGGDGDLKLEKLAKKKKWRRCPSCRIFVSKRDGCNSMSCWCGTSFCYKCGDDESLFGCTCFEDGRPLTPPPPPRLYNFYAPRFQGRYHLHGERERNRHREINKERKRNRQ